MLMQRRIGFVGAGNMAEALIKGLLKSNEHIRGYLMASDPREERLKLFRESYGIGTTPDNRSVVKNNEIILLCIKPQIMKKVLQEIAPDIGPEKLTISIAAGIPISVIEREFCESARVIRVMPNTPALILEGATAISAGKHATAQDLSLAKSIFDSVGKTVVIEESLMDAITGLSGSGPAYIFLIIDALADAGVKMGLPRDIALLLSAQTVLGAAKLVMETNEHPSKLKDQVTSPGGTTIAGLHALEKGRLRATLIDAVEVATARSKELGEMMVKG